MNANTASNAIRSVRRPCPPTRYTGSRPCAQRRTSLSPACARCPRWSMPSIWIKRSAALVHKQTGRLEARLADAIVQAADEVLAGQHRDQFIVDVYQAGRRHQPQHEL